MGDGALGILLLCLGGGALVAMPATGILTTRFGCRAILAFAILLFSAALPLLSIIPDPWVLAVALLVFGVGIGTTDCAMNIQAILVEKAAPRPMMSGFHGYYSIGGIAGGGEDERAFPPPSPKEGRGGCEPCSGEGFSL